MTTVQSVQHVEQRFQSGDPSASILVTTWCSSPRTMGFILLTKTNQTLCPCADENYLFKLHSNEKTRLLFTQYQYIFNYQYPSSSASQFRYLYSIHLFIGTVLMCMCVSLAAKPKKLEPSQFYCNGSVIHVNQLCVCLAAKPKKLEPGQFYCHGSVIHVNQLCVCLAA